MARRGAEWPADSRGRGQTPRDPGGATIMGHANTRRFRPGVDRLDDRRLMTGGATLNLLSGGVLSVVGTDGNDSIAVLLADGAYSLQGGSGSVPAAAVKIIAVDAR